MVNDDLIRRSDVKAACLKYSFYPALVKNALESVPAVEAEPVVHAHWIGDEPGDWRCSHCGEYAPDGGFEQTKRCPDCGAHMDEEVVE